MNGMMTDQLGVWGTYSATWTYDFPPQWTHAFLALSKIGGDGRVEAYFTQYRYRLPSGADATVKLDHDTTFAADKVTSATVKIWTFEEFSWTTVVFTYW